MGDFIFTNASSQNQYSYVKLLEHTDACGLPAMKTKYDNLLVLFPKNGRQRTWWNPFKAENIDFDVLSGTITDYTTYNTNNAIGELASFVAYEDCLQNKNSLETELALLSNGGPSVHLGKLGRGKVVRNMGNVLEITSCVKVFPKVIDSKDCYTDLKVTLNGKVFFRDPFTFTLKTTSKQVVCKYEHRIFEINGKYWHQMPKFQRVKEDIHVIKPSTTDVSALLEMIPYHGGGGMFGKSAADAFQALMVPHERETFDQNLENAGLKLHYGDSLGEDDFGSSGFGFFSDITGFLTSMFAEMKNFFSDFTTIASIIGILGFLLLYCSGILWNIVKYGLFSKQTYRAIIKVFLHILDKVKFMVKLVGFEKEESTAVDLEAQRQLDAEANEYL